MDWSTSRRERQSRSFGRSVPWWSYSCTHFLEQVVPVDAAVMEFGRLCMSGLHPDPTNILIAAASAALTYKTAVLVGRWAAADGFRG